MVSPLVGFGRNHRSTARSPIVPLYRTSVKPISLARVGQRNHQASALTLARARILFMSVELEPVEHILDTKA